jgi:hypothetical protein
MVVYEEQMKQIAIIVSGLNSLEDGLTHTGVGTGLNAQLAGKIEITSDTDDLLGYAIDEVGGVYGFRSADDTEIKSYRERKK